jgi:pilus assembly protein Flp/PilA
VSLEWLSTCLRRVCPAIGWDKTELPGEEYKMIQVNDTLLKLAIKIRNLIKDEEGQDLIEYALVVALIAFAATVGMKTLANDINLAFTNIGSTLSSYTG